MLRGIGGAPATVDGQARSLAARATVLDDAAGRIAAIRNRLDGERTSAARAAVGRLCEVGDGARGLAQLLRTAADVLARFGGRLAEHQHAADAAAGRHAEAVGARDWWRAEAERLRREAAWAQVGGACGGAGAGASHEGDLAVRLAQTGREAERCQEQVGRAAAEHARVLEEHRDEACRTARLLRSLGDTHVVRAWALGAPGTSLRSFTAARDAGAQAAALVAKISGPSASHPEHPFALAERLVDAARRHGSDPVFWTVFWDGVDPGPLYAAAEVYAPAALRTGLGSQPTSAWAGFMAALGAGTAAWSRVHSREERVAFGERAARGLAAVPATGPEVMEAMLTRGSPEPRDGLADVAAGALPVLEADRTGDEPSPVSSWAAGGAFQALSQDPDAARSYLAPADPEVLDQRARLWLGSSTAWQDGATGVTAAFSAAVLAGASSPSRSVQARSAHLASRATTVMPAGLLGGTTVLAPAAERAVALAYQPYLQSAGDLAARTDAAGVVRDPVPAESRDDDGPGTRPAVPLAFGAAPMPQPVQADLDPFLFREVIAASSRTAEGTQAWLEDGEQLVATVSQAVLPPDGSPPSAALGLTSPEDVQAALQEAQRDAGAIHGALQVEGLREAEKADARTQALLDEGTTILSVGVGGVVSYGATKVAKAALRPVLDEGYKYVADHGVSAFADWVDGEITHSVRTTEKRVAATEEEYSRALAQAVHDTAVQASTSSGMRREDALEQWEQLDPDNPAALEPFQLSYRTTADPDTGIDPDTRERLEVEDSP